MKRTKDWPNQKLNNAIDFLAIKCESMNILCGVLNCSRQYLNISKQNGSVSIRLAVILEGLINKCDDEEVLIWFDNKPNWKDFAPKPNAKIEQVLARFN